MDLSPPGAMPLAAIFLCHAPEERRARFAAVPDLGAALAQLAEAGQRAWPELRIEAPDFTAFLGRNLPEGAASDLSSLRAGDLHLVCAYGLDIPGASRALEARYMPRVAAALGRLGVSDDTIEDVQQELRRLLVEMQAPRPDLQGYAGRGDLAAWLRVAAVHEAGKRRDRARRELLLETSEEVLLPSAEDDPEMAHLRSTYKSELQAAFQRALASLTSRERNLLRYHFLEGLTIDQLGGLYGVHRATAARWIHQAREALCLRTRELLAERVSLSREGFRRMLSLIDSEISVHLAASAG